MKLCSSSDTADPALMDDFLLAACGASAENPA